MISVDFLSTLLVCVFFFNIYLTCWRLCFFFSKMKFIQTTIKPLQPTVLFNSFNKTGKKEIILILFIMLKRRPCVFIHRWKQWQWGKSYRKCWPCQFVAEAFSIFYLSVKQMKSIFLSTHYISKQPNDRNMLFTRWICVLATMFNTNK